MKDTLNLKLIRSSYFNTLQQYKINKREDEKYLQNSNTKTNALSESIVIAQIDFIIRVTHSNLTYFTLRIMTKSSQLSKKAFLFTFSNCSRLSITLALNFPQVFLLIAKVSARSDKFLLLSFL